MSQIVMNSAATTGQKIGLAARIWRSIFRGPIVPRTDRQRRWVVYNTLVLHLRPMHVPEKTLRYTHTFGLGGMSLVLVLLLMGTGILMMFVYEPTPGAAHESIVSMQEEILFGRLVRSVHHWSANLLIGVLLLHMLRVFLTGGFHGPRQFNWVIGLFLLFCVLVSNFTGYLLPWDQLSYWAITICTGMVGYVPGFGEWLQRVIRGGTEIGSATLINFYTVHTTIVPVLLIGFMAWHFWRVRKAGGVVIPRDPGDDLSARPAKVLFLPNLLLRETVVALVLIAVVLVISILFDAPLGMPANPGMSPNPAKAPWYFLGLQELLLHFHPLFAVVVIPLVAAVAIVAVVYVRYDADPTGNWFLSTKGRWMAVVAALTGAVVTPAWIVLDELVIDLEALLPASPAVANGLVPFAILLAGAAGFYGVVKWRFESSNNEAIQALFVLLFVAFAVLTVTGVWFRGAGMTLVWPWNA
jgi:quinol-cytochrome oxidoreductase complex cytochrome b subunit